MLVVFTVFVPENSGLERFNYLALREFNNLPVTFQRARGEAIPRLVESKGGYGWTGNDLFEDYLVSGKGKTLEREIFFPWPEPSQPKLCLLGPEENSLEYFEEKFCSRLEELRLAISDKYQNLVNRYLKSKGWNPQIFSFDGQVEKKIRLEEADLAIDIVYSGRTVRENRLVIYDTVFDNTGLILFYKKIYKTRNNLRGVIK